MESDCLSRSWENLSPNELSHLLDEMDVDTNKHMQYDEGFKSNLVNAVAALKAVT